MGARVEVQSASVSLWRGSREALQSQPVPIGEQMTPEQLQSLAVLALAMVPVAVLWWVWIRMLR